MQASKKPDIKSLKSQNERKENEKRIQNKEDRLKNIFGPIEMYINLLESVLIWDYPIVFMLLVLGVHILFWLYYVVPILVVISIGGYICLFKLLLTTYVYSADNDDSMDGWIQVQARGEDQFDLVHCLAYVIVKFETLYSSCMEIKRNDRDKFSILGICFCICLFVVSCFVRDVVLVYFIVMFILFWPGLKYNKLTDKFSGYITPYIASLEKTFHIKRSVNSKKLKKQLKKKLKGRGDDQKQDEEEEDGDEDSDADLKDFIPSDNSFPSVTDDKLNVDNKINLDDDDDSDAGEFMPKVSMVTDSRDASDDDFLPDESQFSMRNMSEDALDSIKLHRSQIEQVKHNINEKIEDNTVAHDNVIKKIESTKGKEKLKIEAEKADDGEGFHAGLSFDGDNDDADDKIENVNSFASYFIGGLLNQTAVTQNIPGAAANIMDKAFSGFNMLKNTLGSVISPLSSQPNEAANNKETQMIDNEFDFLHEEELDEFED